MGSLVLVSSARSLAVKRDESGWTKQINLYIVDGDTFFSQDMPDTSCFESSGVNIETLKGLLLPEGSTALYKWQGLGNGTDVAAIECSVDAGNPKGLPTDGTCTLFTHDGNGTPLKQGDAADGCSADPNIKDYYGTKWLECLW